MPTGYTADIAKPETTFEDFAKHCARNFGAFIHLRDEAYDGTMPRQEVSNYHAKRIIALEAEKVRLGNMTIIEAEAKAKAEFESRKERAIQSVRDNMVLKARYEQFLEKAKAYKPPTPEHENYRKFMIKQIEESIDFDCNISYSMEDLSKYKPLSGAGWKRAQYKHIEKDLAYAEKHIREEIERVAGRNGWIDALEQSLKPGDSEDHNMAA